jgi:ATP-dependent DNA helicase DinG
MRGDFIALDIETTGLNIEEDAIIEIGAVRIRDGVIVAEYGTLINPGFMIPAETTRITGIYPEDVRSAPTLKAVLPQFNEFAGDALLIAHNASFDLGFLRRFGSIKNNRSLDTLDLASILLPHIPRYNLGALTKLMNIPLENAHRALDDARATGLLYWELWKKALELPYALIAEIVEAARPLNWDGLPFYEAALQEKSHEATSVPYEVRLVNQPLADNLPASVSFTAQSPREILSPNGPLAQTLPNYENRPQQIDMAEAIYDAFEHSEHLLVEAGTGTGKSLAYLIPAMQWAAQRGQRVVISTNTTNLQEQLLHKDVPLLQHACHAEGVEVALLKGRDNYLCLRRLAAVRRRRPTQIDELRLMAKILVWTQHSATGDRAEINLRFGESHLWSRLSARDEGCTANRCAATMQGQCPFYQARQRAEQASVLIVNHALLISDANSENRVLPDYRYLIVDEAHQLEDAITQGMSLRIDASGIQRRLTDLGGLTSGILGDLLINLHGRITDKQYLKLETFISDLSAAVRGMNTPVRLFFGKVQEFSQDQSGSESIRIDPDTRRKATFAAVDAAWNDLSEYLDVVADSLGQLRGAITRFADLEIPYYDDHVNSIQAAAAYFTDVLQTLRGFVQKPDPNTIYWVSPNHVLEHVTIQTAPLHIGPLVESHLWRGKESVILTSATLQTASSFDFIQERLFADTIKTLSVGSPFDYKASTLIYIPEDIPEPNKAGYQKAVEQGIIELAAALNGRVLVLFTSYSQLRETAVNIAPRLALGGITVYDQATGGSRETLLDSFKSSDKAVLLGTRSFWEGVDIPGQDLSALVIVRLPFAVPNEPIFAARADQYNEAFKQYAIPDAILRFRQGFGRLIRTQQDRGIVAILDSRIVNKSYGLTFLESLPDCTIKYGPLSELANNAKQWLP